MKALTHSTCSKFPWCKSSRHGHLNHQCWCHQTISLEGTGISPHGPGPAHTIERVSLPLTKPSSGGSLTLCNKVILLALSPKALQDKVAPLYLWDPSSSPLCSLTASEFWLNFPSSLPFQSLLTCPFHIFPCHSGHLFRKVLPDHPTEVATL